jgi:cytochrome P450
MSPASFLLDSDIRPASLSGLSLILVCATILYVFYLSGSAIYNVYFHPLCGTPGPKAWIAFPVFYHLAAVRGLLDKNLRSFHEKYGEAVRFSPNMVSFITAQAWKDIYGHGHKQLPKRIFKVKGRPSDIIIANDEDHTRFRKALSHAFSEKGLRDQEPLMKVYIDLMIEKLKDVASSNQPTDMVKWYNLTTFDIIGDLAFGESFDGLKDNKIHSWVAMIFQSVKLVTFLRAAQAFPLIMKTLMLLMPKSLTKARIEHGAYTRRVVTKRVHDKAFHGRPDFMDSMLKHRGEKDGLTDPELVANSTILIIAGSETTATLLSGVTYWLLQTPDALRKVTEEVRRAFESEEEINFTNATARLPYMLACLDEGFRIYPPVPSGLPRMTLPGAPTVISGHQVAAGVSVSSILSWVLRNTFPLPLHTLMRRLSKNIAIHLPSLPSPKNYNLLLQFRFWLTTLSP